MKRATYLYIGGTICNKVRFVVGGLAVAILLCVGPTAARATVLAHWSFDEAGGTSVADSQRPGSPGTITYPQSGDTNLNAQGKFNAAGPLASGGLLLDDSTDYVRVPRLDMSQTSFSIAAWINPTSIEGSDEIFGDWSNPHQLRLFLQPRMVGADTYNELNAALRKDGPNSNNGDLISFGTTSNAVATGEWQHVAMTWDRATKTAKIYVDGQVKGTKTTTETNLDLKDGNHANYQIGWKADSGSGSVGQFDGNMDELWVMNEALDQKQLRGLMFANDPNAYVIPLGNLFDDDVGTALEAAIATDTFRASAAISDLGVAQTAAGLSGNVDITGGGVQFDFSNVGGDGEMAGAVLNDAFYPSINDGIQTLNTSITQHGVKIEEGIGMHANRLVTFDLDELRSDEAFNADMPLSFISERAGINDSVYGNTDSSAYTIVLVSDATGVLGGYVNGQLVAVDETGGVFSFTGTLPTELKADGVFASFNVPLPLNAKYLTLVTTGAGNPSVNTISADHVVFSGAVLMVGIPEPSTLLLLGLGVLGLAACRRRGRRTYMENPA